ncbi:MAG: tetratricopeptide repeat protein, partial [Tepidisphaeraceae bacterium]
MPGPMTLQEQLESGLSHHQAGRLAEAKRIYRQVLAQQPNHADALHLLGVLAGQTDRLDEAVNLIRQAIAICSTNARYYSNLGKFLKDMEQFDQAIASYRQAIGLKPDIAEVHYNLANALRETGQPDEAIASYREAIRLKPDYADAYNNMVFTLPFHPGYDARMIHEELCRWSQQHAEPLRKFIQPHTNDRDPGRRLRIGYVSPDFGEHPVGQNLLPLLREHDHRQMEIFCYADMLRADAHTEQFRRHADVWRSIVGLSDSQAADLIRQDRIDILVDLALHTANNRLLVFAQKPAPVQVTYLGYCGSTGLDAIDYRLSDPYLDPSDSDLPFYSERTIRLPETYWCYSVAGPTPEPSPPPAATLGYVTFGCLNNSAKVSSPALDLWAEILRGVPQSRLIVHSHPGAHLDAVRERFAGKGISPDRLQFPSRQSWPQYVRTYGRIDIALDPFPWGGGITTCDALWMGVPVVSLVGRTAVGRGGASILANVGVPELVAPAPEQYVQIATDLAKDLPRLAELRRMLRGRMQASPLMDAPRFARNVEAAYRQMWRNWCRQGGNSSSMSGHMTLQQQLESGLSHHQAGRLAEAERIYRQVLAQQPDLADALHLLGTLALQAGRLDEAVELIRRAIAICSTNAVYYSNLGKALKDRGQLDEAIASYRQAIRLKPDFAEAYNNLGIALVDAGQLDEAIASQQQAIRFKPELAEAHSNLGIALMEVGQLDDAIAACRRAIELKSDLAHAHWNYAGLLLMLGEFEEGWREFEWGLRVPRIRLGRDFPQPRWTGQDARGKTILLFSDARFGDALHFIRYAPLVAARGATVLLECQAELAPLLGRVRGISAVFARGEQLAPFDWQTPLMSLPLVFGTTMKTIPADIPYLSAPPQHIAQWARRLADDSSFKVGLTWAGSRGRDTRSCPLAALAPLGAIPGIAFYGLQKGPEANQPVPPGLRLIQVGDELGDFADTA